MIKQAGTSLKNYEDLLELPVKQLVIQSSPISLGQAMCGVHVKNYPVDTGRKLNVHKTIRIRPGRLLNVLCTFNLRPVSTG